MVANEARTEEPDVAYEDKPEGPISAAIIAAGIGAAALGALTTLAEVSERIKDLLQIRDAVGSLSGKTTFAVVIWLVSWAILHPIMKDRASETRRALVIALVLVAVGVIGTFPTFFEAFASE